MIYGRVKTSVGHRFVISSHCMSSAGLPPSLSLMPSMQSSKVRRLYLRYAFGPSSVLECQLGIALVRRESLHGSAWPLPADLFFSFANALVGRESLRCPCGSAWLLPAVHIFLLRASLSSSESIPLHVKSFIIVIRRLVDSSYCPRGHQSQHQQTHPEHIYVCMY